MGIEPDDGVVVLDGRRGGIAAFLEQCHAVRFWPREELVDRT